MNYIIDACWALSCVSDGEDIRIESIMSSDVTLALVHLLSNLSSSFITPSLRIFGNFVSGNDTQLENQTQSFFGNDSDNDNNDEIVA